MQCLPHPIIRGIAFEYRGKVDDASWRARWDGLFVVGSALPMLLLGVAFANIFAGVPIDAEGVLQGNMLTFLNPYGLLGGLLFVLLFLVHGAIWGAWRADGDLGARAGRLAAKLWPALLVVAVAFLGASWFATPLYKNYLATPLLWVFPLLAVAGLVLTRVFIAQQAWGKAWAFSAVTIDQPQRRAQHGRRPPMRAARRHPPPYPAATFGSFCLEAAIAASG